MKPSDKTKNRRLHRRFKVPNDAFAIIKRPKFKLGQISDMSNGGISICYLDELSPGGSEATIDILLTDDDFYIEGIPVSFVWNIDCHDLGTREHSVIKKSGLQFGPLTTEQETKLNVFIPFHSAYPIESHY